MRLFIPRTVFTTSLTEIRKWIAVCSDLKRSGWHSLQQFVIEHQNNISEHYIINRQADIWMAHSGLMSVMIIIT